MMLITFTTNPETISNDLQGAAHSEQCSIFGAAGLSKFTAKHSINEFIPIYGHYILTKKEGKGVRISTDHFGLAKLYYYACGNIWAVSDSLVKLVDFARKVGGALTPYRPAAYAFHLKQGMGQQLASFRTPIQEITLIPHWFDIVIDGNGTRFENATVPEWDPNLTASIERTRSFFASIIHAYLEEGLNPFFLLSGGLDSRCTAAVVASTLPREKLSKIGSYTMKIQKFSSERMIAESLAQKLGFSQLENLPTQRHPSWQEWRYAFLGSYSIFELFSRFTRPNMVFGGSSAENVKPFFDWGGSVSNIPFTDRIPVDIRTNILEDISEAVESYQGAGSDIQSPEQKYYQSFRNRFHFGKDVRDSIFNFPPLVYSMLASQKDKLDVSMFHRIIYQVTAIDIFQHPFDEVDKAFVGTIPEDWAQRTPSHVQYVERTIFAGDGYAENYCNLSGFTLDREGKSRRQSILSDDFFREFDAAFRFVDRNGLMDKRSLLGAQNQVNKLHQSNQGSFGGLSPDLMGILSLGLANMDLE
jgi:hypothetical protein